MYFVQVGSDVTSISWLFLSPVGAGVPTQALPKPQLTPNRYSPGISDADLGCKIVVRHFVGYLPYLASQHRIRALFDIKNIAEPESCARSHLFQLKYNKTYPTYITGQLQILRPDVAYAPSFAFIFRFLPLIPRDNGAGAVAEVSEVVVALGPRVSMIVEETFRASFCTRMDRLVAHLARSPAFVCSAQLPRDDAVWVCHHRTVHIPTYMPKLSATGALDLTPL